MRVSCVMCTRNRPDLIEAAVGSVLANDHEAFELTVIDQSDDDSTERALAGVRGDSRLRYVHTERPGLSAAYNTGIRLSRADIVACTDDDCIAPADWVSSVESAFARYPEVELVYGQTLPADDVAGEEGHIPGLEMRGDVLLGGGRRFYVYGMGANFATKRSLFERIGGFDEMLGGGAPLRSSQDFDYQYRAYRAGAVCLLTSSVSVRHYGARRPAAWQQTLKAYGIGDGAFYFKHVRCGDAGAARMMLARFARRLGRSALSPIRGTDADWTYLRSFLMGIRESMRFPIDRDARLYMPVAQS